MMRIQGALLACILWLGPVATVAAEKAMCVVCELGGETEPEKVVATRAHGGATLAFCSEHCAEEFDADPAAYVFTPGPAPAVALVSLAGDSIAVPAAAGRVTLLDFWATWCKPCVKTMPELDALHKEFAAQGVRVVGVAVETGDDRAKNVARFLEKRAVSYPIVVDGETNAAWEAYHVKALPTLVLIDGTGRMIARWTGAVDVAAVRAAVAACLAE